MLSLPAHFAESAPPVRAKRPPRIEVLVTRGDRKPGFDHAARPWYSSMSPPSRSRRVRTGRANVATVRARLAASAAAGMPAETNWAGEAGQQSQSDGSAGASWRRTDFVAPTTPRHVETRPAARSSSRRQPASAVGSSAPTARTSMPGRTSSSPEIEPPSSELISSIPSSASGTKIRWAPCSLA